MDSHTPTHSHPCLDSHQPPHPKSGLRLTKEQRDPGGPRGFLEVSVSGTRRGAGRSMTESPGGCGLRAWQLTGTGAGSLVLPAPPHQNNENPLGPFCSACAPTSNPKLQPWKRVCEDRRGPAGLLWSIQEGEQGLAWMFSPAENRALGCGESQGFGAGQGAPKMEVEPGPGMCTPWERGCGAPSLGDRAGAEPPARGAASV